MLISNPVKEILDLFSTKRLPDVLNEYDNDSCEMIRKLINDFITEGYGYYSPFSFPQVKTENKWRSPNLITNAILEFDCSVSHSLIDHLKKAITELSTHGCSVVELRILGDMLTPGAEILLRFLEEQEYRVLIFCSAGFYLDIKLKPGSLCPVFHFTICDTAEINNDAEVGNTIKHINRNITEINACCGAIDPSFFTTSARSIEEGIEYNSCLNRKLSVDMYGNIKNCLSMPESFGNIKNTTLAEAIEKPGFKKYWNITKDQVSVCKDCEFRHVCTDCRAYLEQPWEIYSKPLKCGYNPYACEWEEWSTNPLKQQTVKYYGITI